MKLTIQTLFQEHKMNKTGSFISFFTTHPTTPFVTTVDASDTPCSLNVPTEPYFDNLIISLYEKYETDEGRHIFNHAGNAYISRKDFDDKKSAKCSFMNEEFENSGFILFSVDVLPAAHSVFPSTKYVRDYCDKKQKNLWYQNIKPISSDLSNVHIPKYACDFPHLPGYWFALQTVAGVDPEIIFMNCLTIAARRRGVSLADANHVQLATLIVEGSSALVNCFCYNADKKIEVGESVLVERFSADARFLQNGDCEDAAREILNLASSFKRGKMTMDITRRAQAVLNQYIVCENFSAVNLGQNSEALKGYATSQSANPLFAHAHVTFVPLQYFQKIAAGVISEIRADPEYQDLPVLCADGIALFDSCAGGAPPPPPRGASGADSSLMSSSNLFGFDDRMKSYSLIGFEYYKYLCSFLVTDGLSNSDGDSVHELYFMTFDRYGCEFEDFINQSTQIKILSAASINHEEKLLVTKCLSFFQPILPYEQSFDSAKHIAQIEEILGATRTEAAPPSCESFYLTKADCEDAEYLHRLRRRILTRNISYVVDVFAKGVYTVQICVLEN